MPTVKFTKENLLERNQLEAKWYKVSAKEIKEETAKDGESTNYVTTFVVMDGPATGTPVKHWFSEKALGRIVDFLKCFANVQEGKDYELNEAIGRPVLAYISFDPKMSFNTIKDFKKAAA